ncbi:hypothetical protein BsWGS_11170 [Bradybaena similaris]
MDDGSEDDISDIRKKSERDEELTVESRAQSEVSSFGNVTPRETDGSHNVVFTVKVAMAVPAESEEHSQPIDTSNGHTIDAPLATSYYHLEYSLLPGEEPMKTDVVFYGVACKVYMEKHEARVVKTWQEDDVTWIAWAYSHSIEVSREALLQMFNHTVELRLWNAKEMCSSRARFDKPKAFRLPQPRPDEKPEDVGGVKAMVTEIVKNYTAMQPKKGALMRPLMSERKKFVLANMNRLGSTDSRLLAVSTKNGKGRKVHNPETGVLEEKLSPRQKKAAAGKGKTEKTKGALKDEKELKKLDNGKALVDQIRKFGICMIPLKLSLLFGGNKTIISRLENPVGGAEDMFLEVSVDCPLLSKTQEEELNPMFVQIIGATSMPASPISYADLKLKCQPAYCKYKFLGQQDHLTSGIEQNKDIYWNDTNIILLGAMESAQLREYLNGPGMEIEVHDRDRRPEFVTLKPTLFGDDLEDEKISNVGTVESRRTLYNPFHKRDKPWDPYGVARLDFSDLLLGGRVLEFHIPVLNCHVPDILGISPSATGRLVGIPGAVDGPVDQPLSAGHYVQESTMLKVKIQLAHSLTTPTNILCKDYIAHSIECPFNRIIFIFDYHNVELLHNIRTLVMSFNARALELDSMSQHAIDTALSMYKLSIVQQCSLDLNVVTGFHVLDGEKHILVLEGLADQAIEELWVTLPPPKHSDIRVLYNSDLCFSKRLYGCLDVDLCRVKLHEPLSVIVQQPLLYVRDMVFKPCYEALTKLHQITQMDRMRNIVKYDLFPTAEMVVLMSREFGVPYTEKDIQELKYSVSDESIELDVPEPNQLEVTQQDDALDSSSQPCQDSLVKDKEPKNFIETNIIDVYMKSTAIHKEREQNKKAYITLDMEPAYNYSIQDLNSTELVKEQLRQYLKKQNPTARYAYNHKFMSGIFCPVNVEQEQKNAAAASRARWRTEAGWTSARKKSVRESYAHKNQPDSARLDELKDQWVENILHANILKSPLNRGRYPWNKRKEDLDLYCKPPRDSVLLSMHASEIPDPEQQKAARLKDIEDWKSHVVTDNLRQYFHRLLPTTEMKMQGFYSSNQLDRLKGLLKDPPRKYGLKLSSDVNDIPALSVIGQQCSDKLANRTEPVSMFEDSGSTFCGFRPGDLPHSWIRDNNQIPCFDYEHDKFKQLKGHDFNASHKSRNLLSLRPILALRPEEKDNNLFRRTFSASPYQRPLPLLNQRVQTAHNLHSQANCGLIPDEVVPENIKALGDTALDMTPESVSNTSHQIEPQNKEEPLLQHVVVA